MQSKLKMTPLALAVGALFAAPLALAEGNSHGPRDPHDQVSIRYSNDTSIEIDQRNRITNDINVRGTVPLTGAIPVGAESGAVVDTKQQSVLQGVDNSIVNNDAAVDGNAMNSSTGNIGLNVTAGDNNQQTNDAALSSVDAAFVFANSLASGYQKAAGNQTSNFATRNTASLAGDALRNAQGNIGVNISAGDSNVQANALAASVNQSGTLAKATSYTNQASAHNETANEGASFQIVNSVYMALDASMSGRYSGSGQGSYSGTVTPSSTGNAYQMANYYLDTWSGPLPHPNGSVTGHIDVDTSIQNATANPLRSGVGGLGFDLVLPRSTESGSLGYSEAGTQSLAGTVSGNVYYLQTVFRPHVNSASLTDNAMASAQGNIGVNIAAGTNNLQRNSLAISAAMGSTPGGGGGGTE